jgi:predicted RNase H-like nuclease (RuvC/YqgF family)
MGRNDRKTSLLRSQVSVISDLRQQVRTLRTENAKLIRKVNCQASNILKLLAEKHHLAPDAQDEIIQKQHERILELEKALNPQTECLVNTSVTAAALGINSKALRILAAQGKIPCIKDGKRLAFHIPTVKKTVLELYGNNIKELNRIIHDHGQTKR